MVLGASDALLCDSRASAGFAADSAEEGCDGPVTLDLLAIHQMARLSGVAGVAGLTAIRHNVRGGAEIGLAGIAEF